MDGEVELKEIEGTIEPMDRSNRAKEGAGVMQGGR